MVIMMRRHRRTACQLSQIGQYVYYVPRNRFKAEGRYIVMRLLPQPKGEPRYIIRSQDNPSREHTAEENELRSENRCQRCAQLFSSGYILATAAIFL
jgi:hypothetical protein